MKLPLRYAAIAISSLSLSGVALADSSANAIGPDSSNYLSQDSRTSVSSQNTNQVGVTNNNSQNAMSGSVEAGGNSSNYGNYGSWGQLDPSSWQSGGHSYNDWWGAVMGRMTQNGGSWTGTDSSWMPSGDNWQNTWSNWDPQTWRQHGSTYGNWLSSMLGHLTSSRMNMMNGWPGGSGSGNTSVGSLMSGDAMNTNNTNTTVSVANPSNSGLSAVMMPATDTITATAEGPGSSNWVRVNNSSDYRSSNYNSVNVTNSNNQSARSGNVSASRNTWVGNLSSGDAGNSNQTETGVNLSN